MRLGKLNDDLNEGAPWKQWGRWPRTLGLILVLLACGAAVTLIVQNQYDEAGLAQGEARASASDPIPTASAGAGTVIPPAALTQADESRNRALSEFVARHYRVSLDLSFDLVSLAHRVGNQLQLDPLLIIAVIAVESRFNPIAESRAGAKGLMQIIPKYHGDKLEEFGGEQAVFDPATNVHVGSRILKEYLRHTGNLSIALQKYAGALGDDEDQYTRKVLNEKQRLQQVVSRSPNRPAPPVAVTVASTRAIHPFVLPPELD